MAPLVDYTAIAQLFAQTLGGTDAESFAQTGDSASPSKRRTADGVADLATALVELKQETDEVGAGVILSPMNQFASLLQTVVAQRHAAGAAQGMDFGFLFDKDDVHAVLEEVKKRMHDVPKHAILRPDSAEPEPIDDKYSIALVGDFGTGLYGAPLISKSIQDYDKPLDLIVHLGDVYYSGEKDEVQLRLLDLWPKRTDAQSRTLNGNHDMYSQGYGYFDLALPAFQQKASYFAKQNDNFILLFLDTSYQDNDLDDLQVTWVDEVLKKAKKRKVILFSHHPLFSNFKPQGDNLRQKLKRWLKSEQIIAWYWAHEHNCVVYDADPKIGLLARCIGNGGMPSRRKHLANFKVKSRIEDVIWRRCKSDVTPHCLYLDGPNPFITAAPNNYVPHGYARLEFDGKNLEERIFTADGKKVYSNQIGR
jgi:hypothetical protein